MSNTLIACRRLCCSRKPNIRSLNTTDNKGTPSINQEKISNTFSPSNQITNFAANLPLTPIPIYQIQNDIDLDRLTKEYIETINEYRFHLGFLSLELSKELTNRALDRATQLSRQDHIENTNPLDLIHNNEPIGETVLSCRAPVDHGYDIAKSIHDQLINDLKTGHSPKKRYTPILNSECQFLGFGLVRNEEKSKDYIVIYYYPVKKSEDLWEFDHKIADMKR